MTSQDDQEEPSEPASDEITNFGIIMLAAGASTRMGKSKQLLEINGEPLLVHAAKVALGTGANEIVIVLGANEQNHVGLIRSLSLKTITNHYWKGGMGSSLKTGLHFLIKEAPETSAIIIMTCDQPGVTPDHLRSLVSKHQLTKKPIVASHYSDTAGVPALFSRAFFSNILMLKDDLGAKKIIDQFPEQLATVEFPAGSVDLDTAEDYENYIKGNKKSHRR